MPSRRKYEKLQRHQRVSKHPLSFPSVDLIYPLIVTINLPFDVVFAVVLFIPPPAGFVVTLTLAIAVVVELPVVAIVAFACFPCPPLPPLPLSFSTPAVIVTGPI